MRSFAAIFTFLAMAAGVWTVSEISDTFRADSLRACNAVAAAPELELLSGS